jgi:hypothetical protein
MRDSMFTFSLDAAVNAIERAHHEILEYDDEDGE